MPAPNATERFSDRVDNYIRYRPGYPAEVLDLLRERCGLTPQARIADIGFGTGIFTRMLLENGNTVFGIEPNQEMREAGEKLLAHGACVCEVRGLSDLRLRGSQKSFEQGQELLEDLIDRLLSTGWTRNRPDPEGNRHPWATEWPSQLVSGL